MATVSEELPGGADTTGFIKIKVSDQSWVFVPRSLRNDLPPWITEVTLSIKLRSQSLSLEEAEEGDGAEAVGELPFPFASPYGLGLPFSTDLDQVVEEESFIEPTPEEWADLYQAAIAFKKAAPWDWIDYQDVLAVENPTDEQLGYCIEMGSSGLEYGLAVFVGDEGLEACRRLLEGEVEPESFETAALLRSLSVTFVDRDQLAKPDLATIRALGLRFRGRNAWPHFRSQRPGWMPWYLDGAEARFLAVALQQALEVYLRVRDAGLDLFNEANQDLILTRYFRDGQWREEWRKLEMPQQKLKVPQPKDPARLKKPRRAAGKPSGTWELDIFHLPTPIGARSRRPYFPSCLLAVDSRSGLVLGFNFLGPAPAAEVKQEAVIQFLEGVPYLPRLIRVASEEMRQIIQPLANALRISVRVEELPMLEEARESLFGMMGDDSF